MPSLAGLQILTSHLMGAHDEFQGNFAGLRQVGRLHLQHFQVSTCMCLEISLTGLHCVYRHAWFAQHRSHVAHVFHCPACQPTHSLQACVCCLLASFGCRAWALRICLKIAAHDSCSCLMPLPCQLRVLVWVHCRPISCSQPATTWRCPSCALTSVCRARCGLTPACAHCSMSEPAGAGSPMLCDCDY